jgi:hypothetical protein
MDLITIRLADLGEDCVVTNAQGKSFLDISKCSRTISKGYKDQWELKFTTRTTKNETAGGKRVVAPQMLQTEEEKESKANPPYIGSGIRLFDDSTEGFVKPNGRAGAVGNKSAPQPLPSAAGDDLPW